jgi:UDP-glucose 4-epimerase
VEFIEGELADRSALEGIFTAAKAQREPFDGVLHFAALIEAGESMLHPEEFFRNNTASTLSLLEAMLAHGPRRLVFSSTAAVYGEPEALPIKEDARVQPTNPYGESKLLVERVLEWMHRIHGLRSASLRYFNVAGAPEGAGGISRGEAHDPESHLIPLVLDVALGRRNSIKVFGDDYSTPDGTCIRDYIHVSDLGQAHVSALEYLAKGGETTCLNLGTGEGTSVASLVATSEEVIGRKVPHSYADPRPGDPPVLYADASRATEVLGWRPTRNLHEILQSAWNWEQKLQASGCQL